MSLHYREVCIHGLIVSQCRCPSPEKADKLAPCPPNCPSWLTPEK